MRKKEGGLTAPLFLRKMLRMGGGGEVRQVYTDKKIATQTADIAEFIKLIRIADKITEAFFLTTEDFQYNMINIHKNSDFSYFFT